MRPSLPSPTLGTCDVGRWQWVAVAWFTVLLLNIGLGFYFIAGGDTPPTELSTSAVLLAISGSWVMFAAIREEDK